MALHIAPRGWEHEGWRGAFYPDDLPPEWRLLYFCNHFDALVVPEARWRGAAPGELAAWREECNPRNRLFLEREGGPDEPARAAALALGGCFGGFAARADGRSAWWSGGGERLRELRAEIEALGRRDEETLLVIEGDPPSLQALQAARTIAQLLGLPS